MNQRRDLVVLQNDGFDKQQWIRDWKQLKKEYILEDREIYRPLHNLKREMKEFIEEVEKEEKKNTIALRKEEQHVLDFIDKQKTDIECVQTMIKQCHVEPSYLERIHVKVKNID